MPVYTLNPSHRRGARKSSRPTSLRERIAARRNPEPKHLVLMPHRDYVAFRTSDGRTGSEPNMGPGKSGPTMALLLNKLGVLTENGMSPNWTVEVIKQEPSVLDTYLEGLPANRRKNGLSEDGAVVNPRRNPATSLYGTIRAGDRVTIVTAQGKQMVGRATMRGPAGWVLNVGGRFGTPAIASEDNVVKVSKARSNPLSEDGAVVSNPRSAKGSRYVNVTLSTAKGQTIREARYDHPWFGTYKLDEIALEEARNAPIGSIITIQDGTLEDRYKVVDVPHLGGKLRGIQKMRRRNPLSEGGAVVSNPRRSNGSRTTTKSVSVGDRVRVLPAYRHQHKKGAAHWTGVVAEKYAGGDFSVEFSDGEEGVYKASEVSSVSSRRNPLSEDGAVVSNPRAKVVKAKRPVAKKRGSKRSGGRTVAQSNAAKAMKLFHSGRASSLGEAWEMVRGGR